MGLDEVVNNRGGDSKDKSERKSAREKEENRQERIHKKYHKVVGKPPNQKAFKEDEWYEVKAVLMNEMGHKVGEVLSMPEEQRYEKLHEASLIAKGSKKAEKSEHSSEERCSVCGKACDNSKVEIEGKMFHPNHTAGQVASELNNE